ncbi:MAG: hypothetical protein L3J56_10990 [Bacteroidales bacterium]|nr:hypothetical protein [Bacteroidales bacterium]
MGVLAGIVAFIIKRSVRFIELTLKGGFFEDTRNILYIVFPTIGVFLTLIFIKYIIKRKVEHGIPSVLYSISQTHGFMKMHNLFSLRFIMISPKIFRYYIPKST